MSRHCKARSEADSAVLYAKFLLVSSEETRKKTKSMKVSKVVRMVDPRSVDAKGSQGRKSGRVGCRGRLLKVFRFFFRGVHDDGSLGMLGFLQCWV